MSEFEFPFSEVEWGRVSAVTTDVVNATLADDHILRASYFVQLKEVLAALRMVHGEHPILLETEADFGDDRNEQRRLYEAAIELAVEKRLPTYTARISFAELLLDQFSTPDDARRRLLACSDEVAQRADKLERKQWSELLARCESFWEQ